MIGTSLLHLPRFREGVATTAWFTFFSLEAVLFGGLFVSRSIRPLRETTVS